MTTKSPIKLSGEATKVLVTGSRDYKDRDTVWGVLDDLDREGGISVVVHGAAKTGADSLAEWWAKARSVPYLGYPADWRNEGKAAGPLRNRKMIEMFTPDVVLAFPLPQSVGTIDMISVVEKFNRTATKKIRLIVIQPLKGRNPMVEGAISAPA